MRVYYTGLFFHHEVNNRSRNARNKKQLTLRTIIPTDYHKIISHLSTTYVLKYLKKIII